MSAKSALYPLWQAITRPGLSVRQAYRLLLLPLLLLLVLSGVVYWMYIQSTADKELSNVIDASTAGAIQLEEQIAVRRAALNDAGAQLFEIREDYADRRQRLQSQYEDCGSHIESELSHEGAPSDTCQPFEDDLDGLSDGDPEYPATLAASYESIAADLNEEEAAITDQLLSGTSRLFPELMLLLVGDEDGGVLSRSVAEDYELELDAYDELLEKAIDNPVDGEIKQQDGERMAIFAYPVETGSVLGAFRLDHARFLQPALEDAALSSSFSQILLADNNGDIILPHDPEVSVDTDVLESDRHFKLQRNDTEYVAVSTPVGGSQWHAVSVVPESVVQVPILRSQIALFLALGAVLLLFAWLSAYYVWRLTRDISYLHAGALLFLAGQTDHRVQLESEDEFRHIAEAMNALAGRAGSAESDLGQTQQMLDSLTFEIRSANTYIMEGLSSVFDSESGRKHKKLDKKSRRELDCAYQKSAEVDDMTSKLLKVHSIDTGSMEMGTEPHIDIRKIVKTAVSDLKEMAKKRGVKLTCDQTGELPHITGDPDKLQVVITELLANAIASSPKKSSVTVSNEVQDDALITGVNDVGHGIPDEQQAHVFDKFFRSDHGDESNETPGMGLGLYIVKHYVEAMGGSVWFESVENGGSTFTVSLPLSVDVNSTET